MRIGLDGRFWSQETAGLGRYSRELVKNLLKIDRTNQYFLFLLPKDFRNFQNQAKNLTKVLVKSFHYSFSEQIKFPRELRKVKTDFIHFLNFNHPIFWFGKFLITIQDLTLFFYPSRRGQDIFHKLAMKAVISNGIWRAKKIIVPSESTQTDLVNQFSVKPAKIKIIYLGGPEKSQKISQKAILKFKKNKKILKPYILYLGQWRPHKNLIRLVRAFERARNLSGLDFQLVLGGKPDLAYQELFEEIKKNRFRRDILSPGFIPDSDLPLWYAAAEAFVMPSLYEGFGLPPLEALSVGTPVICSDSSSLPEVMGKAALYFDPENVGEMGDAIVAILRDKELQKELVKNGQKQLQKYTWEKTAKETLRIYKQVMK